jgi:hypothetical protein
MPEEDRIHRNMVEYDKIVVFDGKIYMTVAECIHS